MSTNDKIEKEFEKQLNDLPKVNIMIVGGTGVGKSSLVNKIFGEEIAATGSGKPITKGIDEFSKEGFPAIIFDTEGYEIIDGELDNSNFSQVVFEEVKKRSKLELKHQMHLFWYCISVTSHRITDYDLENIKLLNEHGVDLAIVFTQCDNEEVDDDNNGKTSAEFRKIIISNGLNNKIFETMTVGEETLQINDLIEWSTESLKDDDLRAAFVGAQKQSIELKNKEANTAIKIATAAASTAAGLNPFPLSDSLALIPIQMGLAVKLANIYGFTSLNDSILSLLKAQIVTLIGRQLAASLTKLIPIIGQIVNAGVAGGITFSLGYALKQAYTQSYIALLENGKEPDWVKVFNNIDLTSIIKSKF